MKIRLDQLFGRHVPGKAAQIGQYMKPVVVDRPVLLTGKGDLDVPLFQEAVLTVRDGLAGLRPAGLIVVPGDVHPPFAAVSVVVHGHDTAAVRPEGLFPFHFGAGRQAVIHQLLLVAGPIDRARITGLQVRRADDIFQAFRRNPAAFGQGLQQARLYEIHILVGEIIQAGNEVFRHVRVIGVAEALGHDIGPVHAVGAQADGAEGVDEVALLFIPQRTADEHGDAQPDVAGMAFFTPVRVAAPGHAYVINIGLHIKVVIAVAVELHVHAAVGARHAQRAAQGRVAKPQERLAPVFVHNVHARLVLAKEDVPADGTAEDTGLALGEDLHPFCGGIIVGNGLAGFNLFADGVAVDHLHFAVFFFQFGGVASFQFRAFGSHDPAVRGQQFGRVKGAVHVLRMPAQVALQHPQPELFGRCQLAEVEYQLGGLVFFETGVTHLPVAAAHEEAGPFHHVHGRVAGDGVLGPGEGQPVFIEILGHYPALFPGPARLVTVTVRRKQPPFAVPEGHAVAAAAGLVQGDVHDASLLPAGVFMKGGRNIFKGREVFQAGDRVVDRAGVQGAEGKFQHGPSHAVLVVHGVGQFFAQFLFRLPLIFGEKRVFLAHLLLAGLHLQEEVVGQPGLLDDEVRRVRGLLDLGHVVHVPEKERALHGTHLGASEGGHVFKGVQTHADVTVEEHALQLEGGELEKFVKEIPGRSAGEEDRRLGIAVGRAVLVGVFEVVNLFPSGFGQRDLACFGVFRDGNKFCLFVYAPPCGKEDAPDFFAVSVVLLVDLPAFFLPVAVRVDLDGLDLPQAGGPPQAHLVDQGPGETGREHRRQKRDRRELFLVHALADVPGLDVVKLFGHEIMGQPRAEGRDDVFQAAAVIVVQPGAELGVLLPEPGGQGTVGVLLERKIFD